MRNPSNILPHLLLLEFLEQVRRSPRIDVALVGARDCRLEWLNAPVLHGELELCLRLLVLLPLVWVVAAATMSMTDQGGESAVATHDTTPLNTKTIPTIHHLNPQV